MAIITDPLSEHDILVSQATPPGEKLRQALDAMDTGLRLKMATLRAARPGATEVELKQAFEAWLFSDD